jgi:hypothetical protein
MAGVALILRYQWRASWRRFIRTRHRVQLYLTVLAVLGWCYVVVLPPILSRAARELPAGQSTSMDAVLGVFCLLWLFVVAEEAGVSLTSRQLLAFPLRTGSLLAVRILSLFCSPVTLAVAAGSLISLWPMISARHPVLGAAAAVWLFALAFAAGMSVSHLMSVAGLRRTLLVPAAIAAMALVLFLGQRPGDLGELRGGQPFAPPQLATAAAVAATPAEAALPLVTLLAIGAVIGWLLVWSFRRSLYGQASGRPPGRAVGRVLWIPGRFGGLVRKEQYYFRKLLDLWPGLLVALAMSVASLVGSPAPLVRQVVIVIVFALNVNLIMNGFGLDTAAGLNRYFILPLSGREVLLVKNLGIAIVVAAQMAVLIATALLRVGPAEAAAEAILAAVLLLSHLAWGNMASVAAPFPMHFYRFASNGEPLTVLAGLMIGSVPGIVVLRMLHSTSAIASLAIVAILSLVTFAYVVSLHYAGKSLAHRRHVIGERLS